jgi:DHA2 family multidrug resistance protein
VTLAIVSVTTLAAFVWRELATNDPVVHLRVFKIRTYATGVFLMTILGFVLYGSLVLLPIFLQTLLGYPALKAGIAMFPRGLGSFLAMPLVGVIIARVDPRKLLGVGLIGASFTLFQLSQLNLNAGYWDIFWPQLIQGAAVALVFVPLTTATMDPIPKEEMGNATSLFNVLRNVGGSVGIAVSDTFLFRREQIHTARLVGHVNPYNPQAVSMIQGMLSTMTADGSDTVTALQQAYRAMFGMVERQAAMLSFVDTFRMMGLVFLLLLPLLIFMKRPSHKGRRVCTSSIATGYRDSAPCLCGASRQRGRVSEPGASASGFRIGWQMRSRFKARLLLRRQCCGRIEPSERMFLYPPSYVAAGIFSEFFTSAAPEEGQQK